MRRLLLLWFLVVLFCAAGIGAIITLVSSDIDLQSRLISLLFVAAFFFAAWHFASLAIHPAPVLSEEERRQRAAQVTAIKTLPIIEYPESLVLRAGEVCHYQSPAQVLVEPAAATWISAPRTYPGNFSITNGRLIMTGHKNLTARSPRLQA